jgi:cytochrome oxidase Cu insertion factor (SCO1/SenC/PrrC family)
MVQPANEARRRKGRRTLILIFLVCAAPFVLGTLAYYFFPTSARTNYGELLPPQPLPDAALQTADGGQLQLSALKGKWIMVQFNEGNCLEPCERKLYNMRQSRLAQGAEAERIERLWLVLDQQPATAATPALYEDMIIARPVDPALMAAFPAQRDVREHIYLIDPLGNLMMRFPPDPDPKKIIKDLQRLLKVSRIG